jgi:hypothetical protein
MKTAKGKNSNMVENDLELFKFFLELIIKKWCNDKALTENQIKENRFLYNRILKIEKTYLDTNNIEKLRIESNSPYDIPNKLQKEIEKYNNQLEEFSNDLTTSALLILNDYIQELKDISKNIFSQMMPDSNKDNLQVTLPFATINNNDLSDELMKVIRLSLLKEKKDRNNFLLESFFNKYFEISYFKQNIMWIFSEIKFSTRDTNNQPIEYIVYHDSEFHDEKFYDMLNRICINEFYDYINDDECCDYENEKKRLFDSVDKEIDNFLADIFLGNEEKEPIVLSEYVFDKEFKARYDPNYLYDLINSYDYKFSKKRDNMLKELEKMLYMIKKN